VKGRREVKFGHKVDVVTGKSNLILGVKITEGNPADSTLFKEALDTLVQDYG
jgi:IS5 family transposase